MNFREIDTSFHFKMAVFNVSSYHINMPSTHRDLSLEIAKLRQYQASKIEDKERTYYENKPRSSKGISVLNLISNKMLYCSQANVNQLSSSVFTISNHIQCNLIEMLNWELVICATELVYYELIFLLPPKPSPKYHQRFH